MNRRLGCRYESPNEKKIYSNPIKSGGENLSVRDSVRRLFSPYLIALLAYLSIVDVILFIIIPSIGLVRSTGSFILRLVLSLLNMVLADLKLILSVTLVIFVINSRGVPGRFAIIDNFVESAFLKINIRLILENN